jgi:glutathione S-transferase
MLKIWGRANSANVQKVLWCCDELRIPFDRIDAGLEFGRNTEPEFLAKNPNGLVPMIEDGDFVLWESNAILRYLAMQYKGGRGIYPVEPDVRASIDRWLDWTLATLQPAERPVFIAYVRTAPEARNLAALNEQTAKLAALWGIVDRWLEGRRFIEYDSFTLADIVLGIFARRWYGIDGLPRPSYPHLERWYERLTERASFTRLLSKPLS